MPSGTQEISILFTLLQLKPPAPSILIISFSNSSNFFFSYPFPCVLSPGLPSTFLFWRVGFLLLSSSCCNGILPLIPILEIEILLSTDSCLLTFWDFQMLLRTFQFSCFNGTPGNSQSQGLYNCSAWLNIWHQLDLPPPPPPHPQLLWESCPVMLVDGAWDIIAQLGCMEALICIR